MCIDWEQYDHYRLVGQEHVLLKVDLRLLQPCVWLQMQVKSADTAKQVEEWRITVEAIIPCRGLLLYNCWRAESVGILHFRKYQTVAGYFPACSLVVIQV